MPMKHWTVQDAATLYGIREWGSGYFGINAKGHLEITPTKDESLSCDVYEIVQHLKKKGIRTPVNLRFPQVLADRVIEVNESFRKAIIEFGYEGGYQGVYPVKTNQTKEVVEEIVRAGNKYHYGLEAGSKPELMIALSIDLHPEALVLCNGYKDESFIRMALLARKAGRKVVITVEKMTELPLILKVAKELKVEPLIGLRAKLNAQGSGKWETSAGDHAKFGLTTREILDAIEVLEKRDLLDCVIELHFHIGSQITDIRKIKSAMKEATRIYAKLRKLGVPIRYLNVGGGLGVDYDGSKTTFSSSMNYTTAVRRGRGLHHQGHLRPGAGAHAGPAQRVGPGHRGLPRGGSGGHHRPHRHHSHLNTPWTLTGNEPQIPQGAGLHPATNRVKNFARDVRRRHHSEGRDA